MMNQVCSIGELFVVLWCMLATRPYDIQYIICIVCLSLLVIFVVTCMDFSESAFGVAGSPGKVLKSFSCDPEVSKK